LDSARAEHARNQIQVGYTEIRAPFSGLIVRRYIKDSENVGVNQPLFRLSDFDPLLCNIRLPERELPRLSGGQLAGLTVEAYGQERFEARVIRISPVVEAESGTIKVTLEADPQGLLRPGMFASVALEVESREGALVIPKAALSLDSIGDSVFVAIDGAAVRREIEIGYREGDRIEVLSGLEVGEQVVIVGQDGLADGTPVQVVGDESATGAESTEGGGSSSGPFPGPRGPEGPGMAELTPERIESIRERMKARGMSETEIDERIQRMRDGAANSGDQPRSGRVPQGN
jgi:membrane fusion protein (multidrug efflux system)